jgi:hypothetical protein
MHGPGLPGPGTLDPGPRGARRSRGAAGILAGVLAGIVAAALTGCSGSDDAPVATPTAASATPTLTPTATAGPAAPTTTPPKKGAPALAPSGAPSVAVSFAPPVKAGVPAPLTDTVKVTAGRIRTITVGANGPGEVAGPAVAVPLTVRNGSARAFDLNGLAVNVTYHGGTPANQTTAGPTELLSGSLKPGAEKTGTYVFTVPRKYAAGVRIQVSSDESPTIVQFDR